MKRREPIYIAVIILLAAVAVGRGTRNTPPQFRVVRDTVVVRDTIRDTVPVIKVRQAVRTDTVFLRAAGDTVFVEVEVPVERRIYETDDYRAVVEGFRPALAEIELYRTTVRITETAAAPVIRKKRWGVGVQAGYGYGAGGVSPYVGVGVQYNIIMW